MSRAAEYFSTIPLVTCGLLAVNVAVHIAVFLSSISLNKFMINAHLVLVDGEYFRIVSSAFVHGGIMHILMNMSSLIQLGPSLEAQFGSLKFLLLTLWSVILIGGLYCLLSW
jgi:membrane associated rhomboid family serine protease